MRFCQSLPLAAALILASTAVLAAGRPEVLIGDTRISGKQYPGGIAGFLGLPFAEAPVGKRRWRAPVRWRPTGEPVDAGAFAPACMQSGSGLAWYHDLMRRAGADPERMPAPAYSEDCLYLNVWTDLDAGRARPVLVYIHGGSNTGGWSYEPNYHGQVLAREGVVVVTVAYRLGVFGWLTHPQMDIRNPALYDLAASLDWIEQYIGAFGGDPENVTVMGESAGAANALHLAISPLARGRVRRVIHQSGGWPLDSVPDPAAAEQKGLELQQALLGESGSLEDLRRLPAESVMTAVAGVYEDFYFDPVEDPVSLPVTLAGLVGSGRLPVLEILLGTNANESLMYLDSDSSLEEQLGERVPAERRPAVATALSGPADELQKADRLATALGFTCPTLKIANAVHATGGTAYVYRFDRVRSGLGSLGAYHGAELPYVFDRHDDWLPTDVADRELTQAMKAFWVNFAATGNPNAGGKNGWPAWAPDQRATMRLDTPLRVTEHPERSLCRALAEAP